MQSKIEQKLVMQNAMHLEIEGVWILQGHFKDGWELVSFANLGSKILFLFNRPKPLETSKPQT